MDEPTPDLTAFLTIFDNLPAETKAIALQHFLKQEQGHDDITVKHHASTPSSIQDSSILDHTVHSCHICSKLLVKHRVQPWGFTFVDDGFANSLPLWHLRTGSLRFSKEALIQGLLKECVLVRWTFSLLRRGLATFKHEVLQKCPDTATPNADNGIETTIEDLDYIDTEKGVEVTLDLGMSYGDVQSFSPAKLEVSYSANSFLVDALWEATKAVRKERYESFEKGWGAGVGSTSMAVETGVSVSASEDDHIATDFPVQRKTRDVQSDTSFSLAKQWLQACDASHTNCPKQAGTLPSRVIDIGTRFPIRSVRLYWPEDGETAQYSALSYCWGGPQPVRTTSLTAQDFTDGIMFSRLPKTLQDAMIATFKLGLRYIWIDCLCILQDDDEDLAREISKMAQTFQQAAVTISAASSRSVHDGFLTTHQVSADVSLKVQYQTEEGVQGRVYVSQPRRYKPEEDPISLRAWTLQEHILSRRILMYSTREMWWTCASARIHGSEGHDSQPPINRPSIAIDISSERTPLGQWRSTVRDYTRRFLTYSRDKLPAIAGVAADYSTKLPGAYHAGLWGHAMTSELMWSSIRSDISRPQVLRAPSWSWASVDGEVSHDWSSLHDVDALRVLECHVSALNISSPFGEVDPLRSTLKVEGEIAPLYWREDKKYIYRVARAAITGAEENVDVGRTHADAAEKIPWTVLEMRKGNRQGAIETEDVEVMPVWALMVMRVRGSAGSCRGLVLVKADGGDEIYRRVGIFFRCWQEAECAFEKRVIEIV